MVACAGTNEPTDGTGNDGQRGRTDCIPQSSIRGYTVLDEQNLIVDSSGRRRYHVVLRLRARGLQNSLAIAFDSPTSRVCPGFSDVIYEGFTSGRRETMQISSIRSLSREEQEDLLIRFGKKEPEIRHTPAPQEVEGAEVEELDPTTTE